MEMGDNYETFHIAMFPWFGMGHITPFLHLANKLAERSHKISFFLPPKAQAKFEPFNHHPNLISFIPITVPPLHGLPPGAETTADIPPHMALLLMAAWDLTKPALQSHLRQLKPQFVFLDNAHWLPALARELGIKSVHYCIVSPATIGYTMNPARNLRRQEETLNLDDLMEPPPGFPSTSKIKLHAHEAQGHAFLMIPRDGNKVSFAERLSLSLKGCDAIAFKACNEMEGPYCQYVEKVYGKPVLLAGPVVPGLPSSVLEEPVAKTLDGFEAGSLVFVCFGTECVLTKDQFQELVLGLELTGLPFLAALRPPIGAETIESALPEGFLERVKGRGFVYGGWVQQPLILKHRSVGCYVTHCGSGSVNEGVVSECQLVFLPNVGDQFINARLMGGDLRVGVEVEKGENDGLFTRDGVSMAVKAVMDGDSEVGREVRENHKKWREFLLSEGLESAYVDRFVLDLRRL